MGKPKGKVASIRLDLPCLTSRGIGISSVWKSIEHLQEMKRGSGTGHLCALFRRRWNSYGVKYIMGVDKSPMVMAL